MTTPTRTPRPRARTLIALGAVAFIALDLLITDLSAPRAVPLGGNTHVPMVPTNADFPYNRTHNVVAIVLLGSLGLIALAVTLRLARRGDFLPMFVALGTVAIVIPEVFVDIVGMVYYPTDAADQAFTIFGRQMGWFILAGWFGAGAFAALMVLVLRARPTAGQVWAILGVTALSYTIFEEFLVGSGGIYHYYGNQPMWWHNLPLWWTPCNTIGCAFLPAAFAYRYRALLRGWRAAAMLVVVPASVAGSYAFIAMPSWVVVNGNYPWLPTELAGLGTWLLGLGLIAIIMNLFLGYQPFDPRSRPWDLTDTAQKPGNLRQRQEMVPDDHTPVAVG